MTYEAHKAPGTIARNTAIQVVGRIAFLTLSLINFRLIASYLGPSLYGDYGNIFNFIALFTVLTDFGLFIVAVREISQKPESRQHIMENVLSLRFILALGASAVAIGTAWLIGRLSPDSGYAANLGGIAVGALSMLVYFMSNMLDVVFHIELRMGYVALVEFINKAAAVGFVALAIRWQLPFIWIVAGVVVGNIAGFLARGLTSRRFFIPRLRYDPKTWRWLLGMALPLGLVFALNQIYFKVDGIMLYVMSGSYDTGIYTAAYRVLETTLFVSAFFVQAMTPYLSNFVIKKPAEARKLITAGTEILLAAGGAISLAIIVFAPQVISLLAGHDYLLATYPLWYLAGTIVILYINSLLGQVLVLLDQRRILLVMAVLILIFNVGANLWLIPRFSYLGAAAATLVSEMLLLATNIILMRRRHLLDWRPEKLIYILIGLIGLGAALWWGQILAWPWMLCFFGMPIIYFLVLWNRGALPVNALTRR